MTISCTIWVVATYHVLCQNLYMYFGKKGLGDTMGLEKDILRNLSKGPRTYDGLKQTFPYSNLAQVLINMENQYLIKNRDGAWFITQEGRRKTASRKHLISYVLVVPAIIFILLSAQYYSGYTDAQKANTLLLQEKADVEEELSKITEQKEDAESAYNGKLSELSQEEDTTLQLNTSYESAENTIDNLEQEINYYDCLERCTPDNLVTVDNLYVKAKVDEITAGLTTLREKQEAIYEFVRDEIEDDEYLFRNGRLDLWEYPEDILRRGKGHYEDKFLLLLTMFRMAGTSPEYVKLIAADVDGSDNWMWVEAYDGSTWWVLDPFEGYTFTENPKDKFYEEHTVIILWWFNDAGFRRG
ncbi:MAG: transglutaminase domain-containing protein [Theionarchaea archaeon]|nr:transglutaminase domain-containing protein [Theionarchaea archaeon]